MNKHIFVMLEKIVDEYLDTLNNDYWYFSNGLRVTARSLREESLRDFLEYAWNKLGL